MKTKAELLKWVKKLKKSKERYLYGFKHELVTEDKLIRFFRQYPSYYSKAKQDKAKEYIGDMATDCSGLISSCTGILRSSQNYYESARYVIPYTDKYKKLDTSGLAVWKSGHIGVSIGKGICIEAKGIFFGVVETTDTPWTHLLYLRDVDYTPTKVIYPSSPISKIMWMQDRLNTVLGADLEVDGIWGEKTAVAVGAFAKQVGKYKWCKTGYKCTLGMLEELTNE